MDLKKITSQVTVALERAGEFILAESYHLNQNDIVEKGFNNLVTYVDQQTETLIVQELSKIVPQAGFITEEETVKNISESLNWVVDPLDGTTNFTRGFPFYSTTVALMDGNTVLLGATYEICRKEMFYGWKDGGAFLNGKPLRATPVTDLKKSFSLAGFPYDLGQSSTRYFSMLEKLQKNSLGFRGCGSAAVELAYVAAGRVDSFFEFNLHLWDIAAGILLVKEAGGTVSDFKGGNQYLDGSEILAAGAVYPEMLEFIKQEFLN